MYCVDSTHNVKQSATYFFDALPLSDCYAHACRNVEQFSLGSFCVWLSPIAVVLCKKPTLKLVLHGEVKRASHAAKSHFCTVSKVW